MRLNPNPTAWSLIATEDVADIRQLLAAIEKNPTADVHSRELASRALYRLDTGLHATEAIPADFVEGNHVDNL